ncbi:NUDIX domain-containing protein [Streptomyces sp. NPDC059631]|uniref:NUDIX domain-containing protein n=1 Tax=unclassified Streptomyces TaxID=2593676 RepID=UPI00369DCF24
MPDPHELAPEKAAPSTMPSLLGVFAHPDDESLLAGGVLAQHAAEHPPASSPPPPTRLPLVPHLSGGDAIPESPAPMPRPGRPDASAVPERSAGWLPPEQYVETVPKATVFACLHFTDEDDRPLQLHSVYSPAHPWQLVGGSMDSGERPWETAVRECREETGLTVAGPPRLLAAVYGRPDAGWPYSKIGLVFDGGRLTAMQIRSIALDPREHDEARVLDLAEWEALMPPRDFARLTAVAEARRSGQAAYVGAWDWETE